jgi:hypothetical protein
LIPRSLAASQSQVYYISFYIFSKPNDQGFYRVGQRQHKRPQVAEVSLILLLNGSFLDGRNGIKSLSLTLGSLTFFVDRSSLS